MLKLIDLNVYGYQYGIGKKKYWYTGIGKKAFKYTVFMLFVH